MDPQNQKSYYLDIGTHSDSVYSLQFYGSKVISSGGDCRILVWDFNPKTFNKEPVKQDFQTTSTLLPFYEKKNKKECIIS